MLRGGQAPYRADLPDRVTNRKTMFAAPAQVCNWHFSHIVLAAALKGFTESEITVLPEGYKFPAALILIPTSPGRPATRFRFLPRSRCLF
jgi:hypothetical protein